ncbi:MAG: cyclic nucleotide-binding domain-containing protein [Anaerolineales bacterium]|nr:cyclic nucleotide-binding domain-containing protein [Anaerolineales bacterium]
MIRRLKTVDYFKQSPDAVLVDLAQRVEMVEIPAQTRLFNKGDAGDSLYVIVSGWVKVVTVNAEGEELVLNHCGPGEAVGEVALIDGEPRTAGVVTLMPLKAIVLRRQAFLDVLDHHPAMALGVMQGLSGKIRLSTTYIEKAIEWSQHVAEGDYGFAMEQINAEHPTVVTRTRSDEARVAEFLSAFFKMVEGVKKREEELKSQVQELIIQVDEARRKQEVETVKQSDMFKRLKSARDKFRQQNDGEK